MSEEIFYRPDEAFSREERTLPAELYNLARLMVARNTGPVFVPIRSMQYLAILDSEEFIFVDGTGNRTIAISWHRFRPGSRSALSDAVPYEAVYYFPEAVQTMKRLQGDFAKALDALASKQEPPSIDAKVIRFESK